MFRIDNVWAVPQLPVAEPPAAPGYFTNGNPAAGLDGTVLDAWWLNMVQEEILTVITSAGMAPSKTDSAQLHEAIRRIAEASNPDLAGFLPLVGGRLYRPGAGDILTITVDADPLLHARIVTNVVGVRTWAFGCDATGAFQITDISASATRLTIGTGGLLTYGGPATVTGTLTANWIQAATDSLAVNFLGTNMTLSGQGVAYSGLGSGNRIGWTWDGTFLSHRIDGQASGGLWSHGSLGAAGGLTVAGNTALAGLTAGSTIINGNLNVYYALEVNGNINSSGELRAQYLGSHGSLEVAGNGNFGSLGCFGNATINGDANIVGTLGVGWANSSGDFAITGGGAFSSNAGQIDICQTGTRANVGKIRLAGNFVELGGTHDVYGEIRITNNGWKPGGGEWAPGNPLLTRDDAIEPYERGLKAIRELAPMIYDEQRFVGLALEDCRAVLPEMVLAVASQVGDAAGVTHGESVDMSALKYALVNAVKELADRVEALERAWPTPAPA